MAVTNTRDITKIGELEQQPEVRFGDALDNLDKRDQIAALSGQTGGTVTLTKGQALNGIWLITGTLTSNLTVKFPATGYTRAPIVFNGTTGVYTVTVSPNSGGAGVVVPQGSREVVYFDGTNVVRVGQQPVCRVYHDAGQTIANTTSTLLAFNQERIDTHGMHDNATNNSRITIREAGIYTGAIIVPYTNSDGGTIRRIQIVLNGDTGSFRYGLESVPPISASLFTTPAGSIQPFSAVVGDYLQVYTYQDSGGSLDTVADSGANIYCEFSLWKIS